MDENEDDHSISKLAIADLLKKKDIAKEDLAFSPEQLESKYHMAQAVDASHLELGDIDLIVVLSGRGDFYGSYSESGNKYSFSPEAFDPLDTIKRIKYSLDLAKKCTRQNLELGKKRAVYIYFNGVQQQNEQLKQILEMEGSFHGYPRRLFLIDTCPLGSTSGQVIALGKFLEQCWPEYSRFWNLARNPNIIIVSSSYHVPRVELSFGCNSPLLTAEFWLYRLDLFNKLDETMRNYALSQGTALRKASIWVIGCDREITENPSWERDLYGDMQAVVNYASRHRFSFFPNSSIIANRPGENIRTAADLIIKGNLYNRLTLDRQTVNVDQEEEKSSTISLS